MNLINEQSDNSKEKKLINSPSLVFCVFRMLDHLLDCQIWWFTSPVSFSAPPPAWEADLAQKKILFLIFLKKNMKKYVFCWQYFENMSTAARRLDSLKSTLSHTISYSSFCQKIKTMEIKHWNSQISKETCPWMFLQYNYFPIWALRTLLGAMKLGDELGKLWLELSEFIRLARESHHTHHHSHM